MKVTVVCDVLGDENNGTTIAAMNLIRSLTEKGHEVRVLCPDADKSGRPNYYIVPACNFGPFNAYVRKNGVVLARRNDPIIRKAIAGADIVHVMMPFGLGTRAAQLARKAGIPVSAGFHAMAENVTSHFFMKDFGLANRLTYASFSRLYRLCGAIHYPTQYLRDLYEGIYGPTNGYVISNGVGREFVPGPGQRPAAHAGRFVIVYTGRYSKEKSHAVLIDAAALSRHSADIQLVFAGSGPLLEALQKRARKLAVPPVFSFFDRAQMPALLNGADLYVHPAEIEAEGIGCLEAISCGLTAVISDSPRCATKAYALDERDLFRFDSPRDLAARIDYWIEHPAQRAAQGRRYAAYAKGKFDRDACMDRMEAMLLETSRNGGRRR